jgi:hypothetical protein
MTDNIYAAPLSTGLVPVSDAESMFYVVSKRKFIVLFIATFSLYLVYWFYRNWNTYRNHSSIAPTEDGSIWPVPRAIFSVFFVHALFRAIKAHGAEKEALAEWSDDSHATGLVAVLIFSNIVSRMASKDFGSPVTDILSVLIMIPMGMIVVSAQSKINIACNDPAGAQNNAFTVANYLWMAVGLVIWVLAAVGLFVGK